MGKKSMHIIVSVDNYMNYYDLEGLRNENYQIVEKDGLQKQTKEECL